MATHVRVAEEIVLFGHSYVVEHTKHVALRRRRDDGVILLAFHHLEQTLVRELVNHAVVDNPRSRIPRPLLEGVCVSRSSRIEDRIEDILSIFPSLSFTSARNAFKPHFSSSAAPSSCLSRDQTSASSCARASSATSNSIELIFSSTRKRTETVYFRVTSTSTTPRRLFGMNDHQCKASKTYSDAFVCCKTGCF